MARKFVEVECESCHGTGLYSGWAEPEGMARICQVCSGKGGYKYFYQPFTKRKGRRGVHTVRSEIGSESPVVSYKDFENGKMPRAIIRGASKQ